MTTENIPQALVRMYSMEVNERLPSGKPGHALGQVLASERSDLQHAIEPWRCFYESSCSFYEQRNAVTQTVAVEANKLREKWIVFHGKCSADDKLDLGAFEPTMESTVAAIVQAMSVWNKKRLKGSWGKAASNFHQLCGTLDSHSNALRMLPQGNQYISIFTGALTTIVQASVNHEKIVEGVSQAFSEIGDHVRDSTSELHLFSTDQMRKHVSDLYAHIFLFFSSVMDWIMQKGYKRVLDSFNQTFMDRFQKDIDTIKSQTERIRQVAAQASRAEVRVSRLTLEDTSNKFRAWQNDLQNDLRNDIRIGLEEVARSFTENIYRQQLRERELTEAARNRDEITQRKLILGSWLIDAIEQGGQITQLPLQTFARSPSPFSIVSSHGEDSVTKWTSDTVMVASRHCEDFFHRDRVRLSTDNTQSVTIPREAMQRLKDWTDSSSNPLLWFAGEYSHADSLENLLSLFAAQLILLLEAIKLPVISYFCELKRGERLRSGNKTREQQGVIALGYSLMRQMVELLLPEFTNTVDLSDSRFNRLDGSSALWGELLEVLQDLIPLMPSTVYIIVDGLHWLSDRSTYNMIKQLLSCLRDSNGKFRVLFTTSGRSEVLLEQIDTSDCVSVDDDGLQGYGLILDRTF